MGSKKPFTELSSDLLTVLEQRFSRHPNRHVGITWSDVAARLEARPDKLRALSEMERTGGEPDVIGFDPEADQYLFCDCAPETPAGRRSTCYDRAGRTSRKEHAPLTSALEMAEEMGIQILSEAEYRTLQGLGKFDAKTSSWILTPPGIREQGGALFCDFRYGSVFVYHNGASSYYSSRGFRGMLRL